MIRVALTELALFLAPFALYALYLVLRRRPLRTKSPVNWARMFWLSMLGAVLAVGFLFIFGESRGAPPDMRYVPPHMENGVYVPGTFLPRDKP